MRLPIAATLLILITSAAHADTLAGRASIVDADTIEIHGERIRILDVDAPESRQPCMRPDGSEWRCGQKAALALADRVGARTVTCKTTGKDKWGKRWLARCTVGGEDVATWLAANGWVFAYRGLRVRGKRCLDTLESERHQSRNRREGRASWRVRDVSSGNSGNFFLARGAVLFGAATASYWYGAQA